MDAPISGSETRGASAGDSGDGPGPVATGGAGDDSGAAWTLPSTGPVADVTLSPASGSGMTSHTDPDPGVEVPPLRARASFGVGSAVVSVVGRVDTPLYRSGWEAP